VFKLQDTVPLMINDMESFSLAMQLTMDLHW